MADTFTQASTFSSDTAAYEALAYFALRPQLHFDAVADVKPTRQTHRGVSVTFFIYTDLAAQTSTLSETADPDAIAASDTTVTVTPLEKGAIAKTTQKLRVTSLLEIDRDVANLVGFNAGLSLDTLARTQLQAGDNVRYAGQATARNTVIPTDTLKADNVRRAYVDLKEAFVLPNAGGSLYWAFISPSVEYDLRRETGAAAWRDPHTYSAPELIWSGETGAFEGFRFISTPRAPLFADCGSSTTATDVYATLFGGKQALALAHGQSEDLGRYPTIVMKSGLDYLNRIHGVGWKWFGAYGRFREASLRRVESASSIGSN
jgi:N4-gp56 family major capsid protein